MISSLHRYSGSAMETNNCLAVFQQLILYFLIISHRKKGCVKKMRKRTAREMGFCEKQSCGETF